MDYYNENTNFYSTIPAVDNFTIHPLTVFPDSNNYCMHHDNHLAYCCLTCCIQALRFQKSTILTRTVNALSLHTPTNTHRRFNLNPSPSVSKDGKVPPLPGQL